MPLFLNLSSIMFLPGKRSTTHLTKAPPQTFSFCWRQLGCSQHSQMELAPDNVSLHAFTHTHLTALFLFNMHIFVLALGDRIPSLPSLSPFPLPSFPSSFSFPSLLPNNFLGVGRSRHSSSSFSFYFISPLDLHPHPILP